MRNRSRRAIVERRRCDSPGVSEGAADEDNERRGSVQTLYWNSVQRSARTKRRALCFAVFSRRWCCDWIAMTPGGLRCLGKSARDRFRGRGLPLYGTPLLVGILVLSACTGTARAQGMTDDNEVERGNSTVDNEVERSNATAESDRSSKEPNCFVPPKQGPCNGRLFRYYFHWGVGQCFRYEYSGCGGTGNNFRSKRKCMSTCWPMNYHMYCRSPVEQGPCQSWSVRFYYSAEKHYCFPFYYSGCGGNMNNFRSEQECRAICIAE